MRILCLLSALIVGIGGPRQGASAQQIEEPPSSRSIAAGIGILNDYPAPFRSYCAEAIALSPAATLTQRVPGALVAEFAVATQVPIYFDHRSHCGLWLPPGQPHTMEHRDYVQGGAGVDIVPEVRLVFAPAVSRRATLRVLGGAGLYAVHGSPVWSVGAGARRSTRWGTYTLDVERRTTTVEYERVRLQWDGTAVVDRTVIDVGREPFRTWQLRIAFDVWSNSRR